MNKIFALFVFITIGTSLLGQSLPANVPPAFSAIREVELRKDIFELAGDGFRGRRAGTLDEMRAAVWVAQKAHEAGLKPAGEDGTYFQFFNINRTRTADRSTVYINEQKVAIWKDCWPVQPQDNFIDGAVIWLNSMADTTQDLQGKTIAMKIVAPNPMPAKGISLSGYRYTALAVRQLSMALQRKGVKAILLVADDVVESALPFAGHNYESGTYQVPVPGLYASINTGVKPLPIILLRSSYGDQLKTKATVKINLIFETFQYPSVNVVAKAVGADPKFSGEYVLFSGHHDHDGIGNPINQDSIWNGADDNASVTVAMLAIGRAWNAKPGKRSALFVWHGAEERGLLGSRWYTAHPTVNREAIVAVLNGDMIGRNSPDSAALLGTLPPHKNSTELVEMAMRANEKFTHFKVDFSWDDPKHPEGWYFRSDHLPYAQAGIPAIFFTTLLHSDYHTPLDEPQRIDIQKLTKMTKWMYATGWIVSQTKQKPSMDLIKNKTSN
jgi:hypothetical protein